MLKPPDLTELKYRQILDKARSRAYQESRGVLNDFTRHNPLYVLISALAFAGTEVLHYANKFATRFAYIYLSFLSGKADIEGSKAKTTLEITLNIATVLEIPVGTKVKGFNSNNELVIFSTDENLIFDGTETVKTVGATAQEIGSKYTINPFAIDSFIQPISFVSGVTNVTQATGNDPKSEEEFIDDTLTALRSRALVAESDFVYYAELAMGEGSHASVIPNLSGDKSRAEIGSVHTFLLDQNLEPASDALIKQVESYILANSPPMAGVNLYFSAMEIEYIRIEMFISIDGTLGFYDTVRAVYDNLVDYLKPKNHKAGDSFLIRQFESRIWLIPGIINFEPIIVNEGNVDLSTTKDKKFVPQYVSATVIQDQQSQEILIGIGEI